jgi:pimeloyl-ACP methyl ester carboxylesterase
MHTIESIYVKGRRTRVLIEGDVHQTPIVLLHGVGRSLEDWQPQFLPFRQAGYRVIAPDLPGSGFSDRLPVPTTLPGLAQGVLETLDVIGETRRLHVMGNSMGGAVALQLLALDPDRVATLNLVSSAGCALATRYTNRTSARMHERRLYVDRSLATDERVDRALTLARQSGTRAVVHESARSLASIRGARPEWRDELLRNVCQYPRPTLIVWGDRDRIVPGKQPKRHSGLTLDFLGSQTASAASSAK